MSAASMHQGGGGGRPLRLLVLGATGMLGHRVCLAAGRADDVACWGTVRAATATTADLPDEVVPRDRRIAGVEADGPADVVAARVRAALDDVRPDVVINAVGLIKQRPDGADAGRLEAVNTIFPHLVADAVVAAGARLVHLSTDCVFDGSRGGSTEDDPPTATDAYGRSKAAGEPSGPGVVVLRTSMIGRELRGAHGLLEWFLAAPVPVPGFARARFSGLTTPVLADLLVDLARRGLPADGLHHVAAAPIDKATLLGLLAEHYRPGVVIEPRDEPVIDRTLDGSRFAAATGFVAPPWPDMVAALAADPAPYDRWRTP